MFVVINGSVLLQYNGLVVTDSEFGRIRAGSSPGIKLYIFLPQAWHVDRVEGGEMRFGPLKKL